MAASSLDDKRKYRRQKKNDVGHMSL